MACGMDGHDVSRTAERRYTRCRKAVTPWSVLPLALPLVTSLFPGGATQNQFTPLVDMNLARVEPGFEPTCLDAQGSTRTIIPINGWWDVGCVGSNIASLNITGMTQKARRWIPGSISALTALTLLKATDVGLAGSLPVSFSSLNSLQHLDLSNNNLQGLAEPSAFALHRVTYMDISNNPSFAGEMYNLPWGCCTIQEMTIEYMNIANTAIMGPLPGDVFLLTSLSSLVLTQDQKVAACSRFPGSVVTDDPNTYLCQMCPGVCVQRNALILTPAQIAGIVVGGVVLILLVAGLVFLWIRRRRRKATGWENQVQGQMFRRYTLAEVKKLTGNFRADNVLGKGAFGIVYLGVDSDGHDCAVKSHFRNPSSKSTSKLELTDFEKEITAVSKLKHKNLIRMLGYCIDSGTQIQVYEYAPEGSLDDRLRGRKIPRKGELAPLSLEQRLTVLVGTAEGLQYLHSQGIVHRDIKPGNVLLDEGLQAKVADFGLLKDMEEGSQLDTYTSAITRVAGTIGYLDPEYAAGSKVSKACDVYSLGVVMLELVTGRRPRVEDHSDLSIAYKHRKPVKCTEANILSELSLDGGLSASSGLMSQSSDDVGEVERESYPLPLKEWVSIFVEAEEFKTLMDPFLVETEELELLNQPDSQQAAAERGLFSAFFGLALSCLQLSIDRPLMGAVSSRLSAILQEWRLRGGAGAEVAIDVE